MAHPTPDLLALIALGEDVEPPVLDHVAGCRTCFVEIESLQQVVVVGRSLGPEDRLTAPHPRVWQRISTDVNDGRVIPLPGAVMLRERPVVSPGEPEPVALGGSGSSTGTRGATDLAGSPTSEQPGSTKRARRYRPRWFATALAAAVALVVGLGGGFVLKGVLDPSPDVVGAAHLNALPQWPGADGTASVEKDPDGQRTLVVSVQIPPRAPVDGTFEVWMSDTRAEDMVPMGLMPGTSGRFPIPASMNLTTHPIIDVSLEPQGDTDPAHSDDSVVRGRLAL